MLLLTTACLSRVVKSYWLLNWLDVMIHFTFNTKTSDCLSVLKVGLPGQNQAIHNDILEGWFAKERSGEHQQGVEPTTQDPKLGGLQSVDEK